MTKRLSKRQVRLIGKYLDAGYSQAAIARIFDVSPPTIRRWIKVLGLRVPATMSNPQHPLEVRKRAVAMFRAGTPVKDIAEACGTTTGTVCRWATAAGLTRMSKRGKRDTQAKMEVAKELLEAGHSYRTVAINLGVCEATVYKWRVRLGLPDRDFRLGPWLSERVVETYERIGNKAAVAEVYDITPRTVGRAIARVSREDGDE